MAELSTELADQLATWPGVAAVIVVGPEGPLAQAGVDAVYPWASVTKVLLALAVLDVVREGTAGLDDPAGPPGATLADLLSHASGLSLDGSRVMSQPGRRRIYSNAGIEQAAAHLEARTGRSWSEVARDVVLRPLGMDRTHLDGSAAHGAAGPVADLARLAGELLTPRVLDPQVVTMLTTVTRPALAGVLPGLGRQDPNPWGLGVEVRGAKAPHWTSPEGSPRTFGHFGQSGSFLWVDPEAGVACVSAGDEPFGPWAAERWPVLSTQVLQHRRTGA